MTKQYFCQACFQIETFGSSDLKHTHTYISERTSEADYRKRLEAVQLRYQNYLNNKALKKQAESKQL